MNSLLQHQSGYTGVKICGLQDEECVDVAVGAGADAIGFVLVPSSPRNITRQQAERLMLQLPSEVVAIAVLQDYPDLLDFAGWNGWLQLCGEEDEKTIAASPCPVIRAFEWNHEEALRWDACANVHALLIDGSSGGLGNRFDLSAVIDVLPTLTKPVILAGGLTHENVTSVIAIAHPTAVDVSSGVEITRGVKDPEKICDFIHQVRMLT